MKQISGGVTAAKGYKAACCEANIKYKDRTDMAMVVSEVPCECAGTFTTNVVKAACVQWDQKIVYSGDPMQAVVVNSGIANACTGKEGFDACEATAWSTADRRHSAHQKHFRFHRTQCLWHPLVSLECSFR